jgi:hypothetical protein
MKDPDRIGFLALSLVCSTLAWIALVFGGAGTGSHEHAVQIIGTFLVFLAAGYGLLSLALALRGFGQFDQLRGRVLQVSLSVAGFFSAWLLGVTFNLGDVPAVLTFASFVLAALPWVIPMIEKTDAGAAPVGTAPSED